MAFISLPHPLTPGRDSPAPPTQSTSPSKDANADATTKKYTLIFLASIGTTLLITGFTGRKGMKRVRELKPVPGPVPASGTEAKGKSVLRAPSFPSTSSTPTTTRPTTTTTKPSHFPPSAPYSKPPKHLKHWYLLPTSSPLPSSSSSSSHLPQTPDFFAPNSTLLSSSLSFAEALDRADKLHEDGAPLASPSKGKGKEGEEEGEGEEEDGFNGALFAMKALGIATFLVGVGAVMGVGGLMWYLDVKDLPTLALALRQTLSPSIQSNRPTLPSWSIPSSSSSSTSSSSPDDNNDSPLLTSVRDKIEKARILRERGNAGDTEEEEEEVMSYWTELKLALDEEAEEEGRERERRWREVRGLPEVLVGGESLGEKVELGKVEEVEDRKGGWSSWLKWR